MMEQLSWETGFVGMAAAFCAYWVAEAFLLKKEGPFQKWHLPVILGAGVLFMLAHRIPFTYNLGQENMAFRLVFNISVSLLLLWGIHSLFQGGFLKKVFVGVVTFVMLALGQMVYMVFVKMAGAGLSGMELGNEVFGVALVQCILALVLKLARQRKQAMGGNTHMYLVQSAVPLLSLAVLWLRVYQGLYVEFGVLDFFIFFCILLMNFVLYYVFEMMESYYARNQEFVLQEQRHQLLEEYYLRVEAHQKEIRAIKHDMKNQLLSLSAYVEESKAADGSAVSGQINELVGQLSENTEYDFTAHPGLNALLGAKYRQAQAEQIVSQYEVKVPADLGIGEKDLATVVGNVLDNAIEACRHCQSQRYIRFKLIYYNGALILSCENSTDGKSQSLKTRKQDPRNHGIGMQSIRSVAEKYGGDVQHQFDEYQFRLELTLFSKSGN